jgi:hypothetical protein
MLWCNPTMPRAALAGAAAMLLIALAALTPGTSSAMPHGRQVSSNRPAGVSHVLEVGTVSGAAGASGASSTSLRARPVPAQPSSPTPTVASSAVVTKGGDAPRPPTRTPINRPASAVRSGGPAALATQPPAPAAPSGHTSTLATFYAATPPAWCWDGAGGHAVRESVLAQAGMFVAIRGLACGTVVTIRGAIGTAQAVVWDHGPNCSCPERGVDASDAVFAATVGSLGQGIGPVEWWVN